MRQVCSNSFVQEKIPSMKTLEGIRSKLLDLTQSYDAVKDLQHRSHINDMIQKLHSLRPCLRSARECISSSSGLKMMFLTTSEGDDTTNINDKLWKFGQRFGTIQLNSLPSSEGTLKFKVEISLGGIMRIQYVFSSDTDIVTYDDFFFSVMGKQLYHRSIKRRENWHVLYEDEAIRIFRTSEVDQYADGAIYERLFILSK